MSNQNTRVAWEYHNATKHSYWSVRTSAHYLDWANQPLPFKVYSDLDPIPLPRTLPERGMSTLQAIATTNVAAEAEVIPDVEHLAHLLFYSAGITKKKVYPGGEIDFRAAACAGALYPIELYVVCGDLPGLPAGVYHFNPGDFALRQLRAGDYRQVLRTASGGDPSIQVAPAVVVHTAITWRSSWKYRARSYRYHFWDDGMILANMLAAAVANRLPTKVVMGFIDDEVNHLIGVDGKREMSLALTPLGRMTTPAPLPAEITALNLKVQPLSGSEVEYPIIQQMHAASNLTTGDEVRTWRDKPLPLPAPAKMGKTFELQPRPLEELPEESLESVIRRRGSTRRFAHRSIPLADLSTMLVYATREIAADFTDSPTAHLNDLYLNVHAVEGLPAGAYYYRWEDRQLELLKEGEFRKKSSYLCLEQEIGGDSSATIFFLADLPRVLQRLGNRGYRAAQMEAGIIGGKLYLAAYALGRGATGLTFYDDEVTDFFSPHAQGKSAMFIMAVGVPGRRHRV